MRWEVLLAALIATAGCVGIGTDEEVASTSQAPGNTSNATANGTADELVKTTHDGTITGASTPAVDVNTPESDTVQEVQVPEGTQGMFFRVAPDGGPVRMLIASPDCEPNSGCEEQVTAEDQADASKNITDPASGTWTLRFFYGETGAGVVAWTLHAWQKVPTS